MVSPYRQHSMNENLPKKQIALRGGRSGYNGGSEKRDDEGKVLELHDNVTGAGRGERENWKGIGRAAHNMSSR